MAGLAMCPCAGYALRALSMESFRDRVHAVVASIPKGKTLTYGQVAALAGNPKAARAVGAIMRTNYDSHIPCHRVVRADGSLGGYNRGGRKQKYVLLSNEHAL